jgi:hypothetical protein
MRLSALGLRAVVAMAVGLGSVVARADLFAAGRSEFATLMRFSAGQLLPRLAQPISEGFGAMTRGPDGDLYFGSMVLGDGAIHKLSIADLRSVTTLYQAWGRGDGMPPKLTNPSGIGFDSAGRLYVTSNDYNSWPGVPDTTKVYRYDGPDALTPVFTPPPSMEFDPLGDLEFDAADAMYVGIRGAGIRKINSLGGVEYTIPTASVEDFKFGPDGKLYVASKAAGVLRYDPSNGAALGAFVPPGPGGLKEASYITFGDDGLLYVNDRTATAIFTFDALTGWPRGTFTDYEVPPGSYDGPYSIAYADVPEPGAGSGLACAAAVALAARRGRRGR